MHTDVVRLRDINQQTFATLLSRYGVVLADVREEDAIPGSFWGDDEAGLIGNKLYARPDTPLHSMLHEAAHYICMPPARRAQLDTNAGGDYDEENAVCFLQIVLADYVEAMDQQRMCRDMDAWGYSFRLGSARAWFEQDAEDARERLVHTGIITTANAPTWRLNSRDD